MTLSELIESTGLTADALKGRSYIYTGAAVLVPLDRVIVRPFKPDLHKLARILAAIKAGVPLPPVRLHEQANGFFRIIDGTHRVAISRELGAVLVPAVV